MNPYIDYSLRESYIQAQFEDRLSLLLNVEERKQERNSDGVTK
jgi:hypothetical protein